MLWGGHEGELELRNESGAVILSGRFPYNARAVLSDGGRTGRPRKEVIAPRAFGYRIDKPEEDIHLLVGHSYDRPLASRLAGTLDVKDGDDAVTFDATITAEMQQVTWVQDILASLRAGLIIGISPGFRIPPKRAVAEAEKIEDEGHDPANGAHNAIIRTILQALLYEFSIVTKPAYPETQIEARSWDTFTNGEPTPQLQRSLTRWRV